MAATQAPHAPSSGNLRKHTSGNPLQRLLLARFQRHIAALTAEVMQPMPEAAPQRVVEAGCGEGFVLANINDALGPLRSPRPTGERARERGPAIPIPIHTLGLDNRLDALSVAASQAPHARLMLGDALHLPLATASADVVLCLEVLEHLADPWAALAELQRVAHGGAMILSVPNQPWFALANLARGKNLGTWGDDAEHVNHWRGGTFIHLLRERATVRRVVYSFPWVIAVCDGGR